jgi:hypothetical protein
MLLVLLPFLIYAQNDCSQTPGLCLKEFELQVLKPFELFWNRDQIPITINPSEMVLNLHQGDVHFINDPCRIDVEKNPFIAAIPYTFTVLGNTSITIPSSTKLSQAIQSRNEFILQLTNSANVNCQIGPFAGSGAITHFSLVDVIGGTTTLSVGTSTTTPSNNLPSDNSQDSKSPTTLIIIIITSSLLFIILLIILYIYRRYHTLEIPKPDSESISPLVETSAAILTVKEAETISKAFKDALKTPCGEIE